MLTVWPFCSTFRDDVLVTVQLEGARQTFSVQKALLCSASDYFVKALDGKFKEAVDNTLHLPGCDEATFQLFLAWLCGREFPTYIELRNTTLKGH